MENRTINEEIELIIQDKLNKQPYPTRCKIVQKYADNIHADIETEDGIIQYVETISNNLTVGNPGILLFLDGNENNMIVITK